MAKVIKFQIPVHRREAIVELERIRKEKNTIFANIKSVGGADGEMFVFGQKLIE